MSDEISISRRTLIETIQDLQEAAAWLAARGNTPGMSLLGQAQGRLEGALGLPPDVQVAPRETGVAQFRALDREDLR